MVQEDYYVKTKIYIPTLNRTEPHRQVTLNEFLTKSDWKPYLVCPIDEVDEHMKHHKNVIVCPEKGIGKTRQWILEHSDADLVVMADDDMKFQYRPNMVSPKLEQCADLNPMMAEMIDRFTKGHYIHGGLSARQGNNHVEDVWKDNTRCCNFHVLDRAAVLKAGARFDQTPVMEDFHFILSLLTKGFPNTVLFKYCWNQIPGSIGGCNTYRTLEMQDKAANMLHKAFPEFVKVVKKVAKTDWSIAKGERTDVQIQWQKAFKSSWEK